MQQVFSVTALLTWDGRHGSKLEVVRLWLSMLWMTHIAAETIAVTVISFRYDCCVISDANSWCLLCFYIIVACRLWVYRVAVAVNAAFLFVLSTSIISGHLQCTVLFVNKSQSQESLWVSFSKTTCGSCLWCGKHGSSRGWSRFVNCWWKHLATCQCLYVVWVKFWREGDTCWIVYEEILGWLQ
jgi:hypothetical protein